MSEYPWTEGPWQPTSGYPETPYVSGVDAQQYVAKDGVTEGPYVEATGPDRAVISLAPEMAVALLALNVAPDTPFPHWAEVLRLQYKLQRIGKEGTVTDDSQLSQDVTELHKQLDAGTERFNDVMSAVQEVAFAFEALELAQTIGEQSSAYERLSNAMSDLETWHPRYDPDLGEIQEHEG